MWDLIVSVPDHCLSFYLVSLMPNTSKILCRPDLVDNLADFSVRRLGEITCVK